MTITQGQIKLVASSVMGDVPEGGGAPTNKVILDNETNAIFKDISESDRARGRLNMAKAFVSVQSDDTDTYLGSNVIIGRPPEDPNVSISIFTMDQVYDTRQSAASRIEAYLNRGPEWAGYLYENHIQGQRTIQLFQRVGSELPPVGHTLVLVQDEGKGTERIQYVRATRVSSTTRTFTFGSAENPQDYQALIVTLELSDALRYDFAGSPASRFFTRESTGTLVRDTIVADAATYAGVVALAKPVTSGDFTIKATSIYTRLVPSAQIETPLVSQSAQTPRTTPVRGTPVTLTVTHWWTPTSNLSLPWAIYPGSLRVSVVNGVITDKAGVLMMGLSQLGTVDYENGILTLNAGYAYTDAKTITYTPASYAEEFPQSYDISITQETRSQNYVGFVYPNPELGTLTISYRAQGRWYEMYEQGDGSIKGYDSSYGAGTYSRETGSYVVTLGALPDVGSSIVITWGLQVQTYQFPSAPFKVSQTVHLPLEEGEAVSPTGVIFTWMDGATERTATVAGSGSVLQGYATGKLVPSTGQVVFSPNTTPAVNTLVTVAYDAGPKNEVHLAHPARNNQGSVVASAGSANLLPHSVRIEWNTVTDLTALTLYTSEQLTAMGIDLPPVVDPTHWAFDDGNGNMIRETDNVVIGTVDYNTGVVTFNPDTTVAYPIPKYNPSVASGNASWQGISNGDGSWSRVLVDTRMWRLNYSGMNYTQLPTVYPVDESGYVKVWSYSSDSPTRKVGTFPWTPSFKMVEGVHGQINTNSLQARMTVDGQSRHVYDDGRGNVCYDSVIGDKTTPVTMGTISYTTGEVTLPYLRAGTQSSGVLDSAVTTLGQALSSAYVFRTAAAPLRPGSLSIQFASAAGTETVTADTAGVIRGSNVTGTVDYETGLVRLGFGSIVPVTPETQNEPWFNADVVQDGYTLRPEPVPVNSLKYTAVSYGYMPLNADLVGIDPVRLPSDGRVPIFRNGTMVVIGHAKSTPLFTPSVGQTIDLARTRISRVTVRDSEGFAIDCGFEVNLEAGTVTFTDVSQIQGQVIIEDRIEDMLVAREVNINGDMTFTRAVSHDYPVNGSYVSSALEFGDRYARVSIVFDQSSWDGITYTDNLVGNTSSASYNTTLSPIEVTNAGASTERWAIHFTSSSTFRVVGEHIGQIATGDTNSVCSPVNPATGKPYFTIRPEGWGSGWAVNNLVRFNTIGALCPFWVVRTIQPGVESGTRYSFDILTRGDVDSL